MSDSVSDAKHQPTDLNSTDNESPDDFESLSTQRPPGVIQEIVSLISYNKKWYLIPLLVALLLIGVILILGSTAAAPFIYTLF